MQKQFLLSIFFVLLSTPIFILSCEEKSELNDYGYVGKKIKTRFTRTRHRTKKQTPPAQSRTQLLNQQASNFKKQKSKELKKMEELVALAEKSASYALAASTSFKNYVDYVIAGKAKIGGVRVIYRLMSEFSNGGPTFNYKEIIINKKVEEELEKEAQKLQHIADLKIWHYTTITDALNDLKQGRLDHQTDVLSTLAPNKKVIAPPQKLLQLPDLLIKFHV